MLAIHNTAPFKLVRAAAPYFRVKDGEDRVIVNISSTSGIHGNAYVSMLMNMLHAPQDYKLTYTKEAKPTMPLPKPVPLG